MRLSTLGRVLRAPLRLIPPETEVRVIRGPSRGMRWIAGSAPHGAWIGTLERPKLRHLLARLSAGDVFWDMGANVGLYTLPAARRVGPAGRVFAFEPMPRNVRLLQRHLSMNRLDNVTVVASAVGERTGVMRMREGATPSEFHADPAGDVVVSAIALDEWQAETHAPLPRLIKMDVEGCEAAGLRGAERILAVARPLLYVALHGEGQRVECRAILDESGYTIESLDADSGATGSEWLATPR